jgi:hypothetical protein
MFRKHSRLVILQIAAVTPECTISGVYGGFESGMDGDSGDSFGSATGKAILVTFYSCNFPFRALNCLY